MWRVKVFAVHQTRAIKTEETISSAAAPTSLGQTNKKSGWGFNPFFFQTWTNELDHPSCPSNSTPSSPLSLRGGKERNKPKRLTTNLQLYMVKNEKTLIKSNLALVWRSCGLIGRFSGSGVLYCAGKKTFWFGDFNASKKFFFVIDTTFFLGFDQLVFQT